MRKLLYSVPLSIAAAAVGCENRVTTADVAAQRQEVDDLNREVQELQRSKDALAAEAAKQKRADVDSQIQDKQNALAEERQQLGAMQERQAFQDDMHAKMKSLETRIDQLEEHAANAKGEEEVSLREQIAALQTRRDQLKRQMDELEAASGDAWGGLKVGVEKTWHEAEDGMRDLIHDASTPAEPATNETAPPTKIPNDP